MASISDLKATIAGNNAYRVHIKANRLSDAGKADQAEEAYAKALGMYENAAALGCDTPKINTGYAVLLMRLQRFTEAKDLLNKIYNDRRISAQDRYDIIIDHAVCQWKLGNVDKALEDMNLCGDRTKTGLYYGVMTNLMVDKSIETDEIDNAKAMCEEAIAYDDEDADSLTAMGRLLLNQKDYESAKDYFIKAVKASPNSPAGRVGLSQALIALGNTEKAREQLDKALAVRFPTTSPISKEFAEQLRRTL